MNRSEESSAIKKKSSDVNTSKLHKKIQMNLTNPITFSTAEQEVFTRLFKRLEEPTPNRKENNEK